MSNDLNISLESQLLDALKPLPPLLPSNIQLELAPYLNDPIPKTIPYRILSTISQWSRTPLGLSALQSHTPKLEAQAYTMISLLAGTTTSPERKFPSYVPPKEPEEIEAQRKSDRKAITALANALLSILGSGVAVYWAADKTGWRNESRVLLSLFAAFVVAISEAVLYMIWQSRRPSSGTTRKPRRLRKAIEHKINDGDKDEVDATAETTTTSRDNTTGLRQRTTGVEKE